MVATGPGLRASGQHFNRTNQDFTAAQLLATEIEPGRRWSWRRGARSVSARSHAVEPHLIHPAE
jgi:hypothetical protein